MKQARRCVRNGRLRMDALVVNVKGHLDSPESVDALCTDLLKHPSLKILVIHDASFDTAAAMRVLVNAAIALRLQILGLVSCECTHACVPELTRVVSAGMLEHLFINQHRGVVVFEPGDDTNQFCAAVRASASLESLTFSGCGFNPDVAVVAEFINADRSYFW